MSTGPDQLTVLYDDGCSLCTFQMRMITWLDWFNQIALMPLSHPERSQLVGSISEERLQEAIHCFTPSDEIHRGARCIRHISMRMPLAVPIGLLLWIPGVIWVAEIFYKWVSRNRLLLSKLFGCKGACKIMPQRNRPTDLP